MTSCWSEPESLVGAGITMSDLPADIAATRYRAFFIYKFLRHFKAPESWFYPGELLKDKTKTFIEQSHCPVGVFVNRQFVKATHTLILVRSEADLFLFTYGETLQQTTFSELAILNLSNDEAADYTPLRRAITEFTDLRKKGHLLSERKLSENLLAAYNFMLVSYDTWNSISESDKIALQKMPSTLILSKPDPKIEQNNV